MKTFMLLTAFCFLTFSFGLSQEQSSELKDFVTKDYIHGIPYAKAKSFGPQALPELFSMLNDPKYEQFRVNIVATVGMIGDESAFNPLKEYFENQKGEISESTFVSLLVVFQSLGHIGQSGNADVIAYLAQWTDPGHWKEAGLNFTFQNYRDRAMAEVLGRLAIQGLGITGKPEAINILDNLNNSANTLKTNYNWDWSDNIEEAITLNKRIYTQGAEKVFDTLDQH